MTTDPTALALRDALTSFSSDLEGALSQLRPLYSPDVVFRDPIQTLHGWDAFEAMNRRLASRAREVRFDVAEALRDGDHIILTWTFSLAPRIGPAMQWDGISHLVLEQGRVAQHRDHFDLLGDVLKKTPLVGAAYRAVLRSVG